MASAVTSNKMNTITKVDMFNHDPDTTAATDVGWVDMRDYGGIRVIAMASSLTGNGVEAFTINANSDSAGGGTDAVVLAHAVSSAPDAEGDWLVLEVTAAQIREVEVFATHGQLRYVTAILTMENQADENAVVYERFNSRFPQDGLTADTVA